MDDIKDFLKQIGESYSVLQDILDSTPDYIDKMIKSNQEMITAPEVPKSVSDYENDKEKI
jgi:hypothetical protein